MDALFSAFTCGRSESIFSRPTEEEQHIRELETLLTAFQQAYEGLRLAYEAAKAELCLYQQIFGPLDAVHVELVRHLRGENPDLWAEASSSLASPSSALSTLGSSLQKSLRQNSPAGSLAKSALQAVPESEPVDHSTESGPGMLSLSASPPRRPRKGRTMSWSRQLQLEGAIKEGSPLSERGAEYTPEKMAKNSPEDVTIANISSEKSCKVGLSPRAPHERERVMRALDDIKERASDGLLCKLNAFQLQCVRDQARVRVFRAGEVLIHKGVQATAAMHVLLSGGVHLREVDCNLVLPDFSFVGHASALFGESPTTIAAVGDVQTLMLSKGLLECMFGQRLKDVLLRSYIFSALARHEVFKTLPAEELKAAADICELVCLEPNEELDIADLRFALCMFGEVVTSVGTNGDIQKRVMKGSMVESFGEECLLNSDRLWTRRVVATNDARAVLGVWRGTATHICEASFKAEEALAAFLRSVAIAEAEVEQRRVRLCRCQSFRPSEVFAALTALTTTPYNASRISISALHRWLSKEGSPTLRISVFELTHALRQVGKTSTGTLSYQTLLQLLLPRDPFHKTLRSSLVGKAVEACDRAVPREVIAELCRLLEEEVQLSRRMRLSAREARQFFSDEDMFLLMRGENTVVTLDSVTELATERIAALSAEEAAAFYRRLDNASLGVAHLEDLTLLLNASSFIPEEPSFAERCKQSGSAQLVNMLEDHPKSALQSTQVYSVTDKTSKVQRSVRALLQHLVQQGELDLHMDTKKERLCSALPRGLPVAVTIFSLLAQQSKGYVSLGRLWHAFEGKGRKIQYSSILSFARHLRADRELSSSESPLSFRDMCAAVLPLRSFELSAVRQARDDSAALSELYVLTNAISCLGCGAHLQRSATTMCHASSTCVACGMPLPCHAKADDAYQGWNNNQVQVDTEAEHAVFQCLEEQIDAVVEWERRVKEFALRPETVALADIVSELAGSSIGIDYVRRRDFQTILRQYGLWHSDSVEDFIWYRLAGRLDADTAPMSAFDKQSFSI